MKRVERALSALRRAPSVFGLAVALGACAPGLDEGFVGGPSLVLESVAPPADAREIALTARVAMRFNQPLRTSSATPAAFQLLDEGGTEAVGQLKVEGAELSFVPAKTLRLSTTYQAAIQPTLRSLGEDYLAQPQRWSFSTRSGAFVPGQQVTAIDNHGQAFQFRFASDPQGQLWALWLEDTLSYGATVITALPQALVVARYEVAKARWERILRQEGESKESALAFAQLAWDENNNAALLWRERAGTTDKLQLTRFDASSQKWLPHQTLVTAREEQLEDFRLVIDRTGRAQALWLAKALAPGKPQRLFVMSAEGALSAWSPPRPLATPIADAADTAQALSLVDYELRASRQQAYLIAQTESLTLLWLLEWEDNALLTAQPITELSPGLRDLQLHHTDQGGWALIWQAPDGAGSAARSSLWAVFRAGAQGSWSSPQRLVSVDPPSAIERPQLALSPGGTALVSWASTPADARGKPLYFYRLHSPDDAGWGPVESLCATCNADQHLVGFDDSGRPLVIWSDTEATSQRVWRAGWNAQGGSWQAPIQLGASTEGNLELPANGLQSFESGQLAALWIVRVAQSDPVGGVLRARYRWDLWASLLR